MKKKAVRSWTKYRGSIVAVLIRFYKAWKLAFLSWGYLLAAVYWAIYVPIVVPLWCLVTSCSVPRGTSMGTPPCLYTCVSQSSSPPPLAAEHWRSTLSTLRHLIEVVGQVRGWRRSWRDVAACGVTRRGVAHRLRL